MENDNPEREPIWKPYVYQEVCVETEKGTIIGVMNNPNVREGYVDFAPSLVFEADGETVRVEEVFPTRISLGLLEKKDCLIRPLREGYLEQRAREINRIAKRKQGMGFNSH